MALGEPANAERAIDEVCDRFEGRWRAGQRPVVEDHLDAVPQAARDDLLRELLRLEIDYRRRKGEQPTLGDYLPRWPGHNALLQELLGEVLPAPQPALAPPRTLVDLQLTSPYQRTLLEGSAGVRTPSDERITRVLTPSAVAALPEQVGRYKVLRLLRQGSTGTVYLAQDNLADRLMDIKVPNLGPGSTPTALERFRRSARAAARLSHPNLCPIYEVGEWQGVPFLVMPHLDMPSLADRLAEGLPLAPQQAAELVRKLATALQAAHRAGVIHRDMHPANILLDPQGEPIVVDFGLARLVEAGSSRLTQAGEVLGAPAYIAPEQLSGNPEAHAASCDVFSLGVILYELLTGELPFGRTLQEVLLRIMTRDPAPPSSLRPEVDPELDAVCRKALACKVRDRFGSMADLAEALQGAPVHRLAKPVGLLASVRKRGVFLLLALLAGIALAAAVYWTQPDPKKGQSNSREKADEERRVTVPSQTRANQPPEEPVDVPNHWRIQQSPLFTLSGHRQPTWINGVCYSPNGKRIVTTSGDRTAKVWDAQTGQLILSLQGHKSFVGGVGYSPDGKRIVTGSGDNTAKVWDAQTGQVKLTLEGHAGWVTDVSYSPDGKRIVTGSMDKTAKVWDALTGLEKLSLEGHRDPVYQVSYSPDSKRIVTGTDPAPKVWDAETGREILSLAGPTASLGAAVCYSPDGKRIVASGGEGTAKVWDAHTGQAKLTIEGHTKRVASVCYSRDQQRIVTGSWDKTAKVWDAQTGRLKLTLEGHTQFIVSARYSPDGKCIVTASGDGTAKVWDAQNHAGRAKAFLALRKWERAGAEYARLADLLPPDSPEQPEVHCNRAALLLLAGDGAGHRRLRDRLLKRNVPTDAPRAAYLIARLANLAPDEGTSRQRALTLSEQAVAEGGRTGWYLHALGMAQYRAEQYDKAAGTFQASMKDHPNWNAHAANWLGLALCGQRLGKRDEARRWLDKASLWMDKDAPNLPRFEEGPFALHTHDWLACLVLRREAESLIQQRAETRK